ncbi:MAG TPA: extracellular solute-binding protein [Acidobacteriota bacterium]|nr:extracellular solute-binding protein [Acidobacteriota bacterium]
MRGIFALFILISSGFSSTLQAETVKGDVKVSFPSNISFLMEKYKSAFESANPDAHVILQSGAGPKQVEKIISGSQDIDAIVVSDDKLVRPQLGKFYMMSPLEFMSDEIAIIAGKNAKNFEDLQPRTWHDLLLNPGMKIVVPDRSNSYAAYRVPLVWKLAETWVRHFMLYENMTAKVGTENASASGMTALISGEADYAFDYATQAKQHGLRIFKLPKYYNLGDPTQEHIYKGAAIELTDKAGEKKILRGEPIIYSIGQLKVSQNNSVAKAFVDFVAGNQGREILKAEELTAIP